MSRRLTLLATVAALACGARAQEPKSPFTPFDQAAFLAHVKSLGAGEAELTRFAADAEDISVAVAADELLQRVVPEFGAAVALSNEGDPRAALELGKLADSQDPYLRAHSRYHLGRVLLDGDDPEAAVKVFAEFLDQDRNRTPLDDEALFFYSSALADIPVPAHAIEAFADYLRLFPNAPERYRAVAMQRKAELETQLDNPLHDIADVMKAVERDIKKARTGEPTQKEQKDIVARLQKIIEELEEQERQSGGAPSGNSQSQAPASHSAAPTGESRIGSLQRVPGVGDRWGNIKDRDREEIEAEVQAKLPERYRKLLEDYYQRLNRGAERK